MLFGFLSQKVFRLKPPQGPKSEGLSRASQAKSALIYRGASRLRGSIRPGDKSCGEGPFMTEILGLDGALLCRLQCLSANTKADGIDRKLMYFITVSKLRSAKAAGGLFR